VTDAAVVNELIADNSVDFLDYIRWEHDQVLHRILLTVPTAALHILSVSPSVWAVRASNSKTKERKKPKFKGQKVVRNVQKMTKERRKPKWL